MRFRRPTLLLVGVFLVLVAAGAVRAQEPQLEAAKDDAAPVVVIDVPPATAAVAPAPSSTTPSKQSSSTPLKTDSKVVYAPPPSVGKPVKFVPLTEGKGMFVDDWQAGEVAGKINTTTAKWTPDDLFGSVVSCDRDNKDLVLLHPVKYGQKGPFAVSLWVKSREKARPSSSPAAVENPTPSSLSLFEYALSHGLGATSDAFSPSDPFSGPGVHVLLPRGSHGASGLVRAVVKDADDVPGRSFLDSDGRVNDDGDRTAVEAAADAATTTASSQPVVRADDGAWHHVVVSSRPEGGDGFLLYVDGRLRGEVPAPPGAAPSGETLFADGGGPLAASGLSNSSIYLCGRSDGAADRFFTGSVAHVGFWDSALDAEQVSSLYESVPVAASSSGAAAKAAAVVPASSASSDAIFRDAVDDSGRPAVAAAVSEPASASGIALLAGAGAPSPSPSTAKPPPSILTVSGTPCVFPFNYGGLERWSCVPSAADGGKSSFCQDAAGHLSRCAAGDDAELGERFGAIRAYLDQYVAAPGGALVAGPDGKVALCSRRRSGGKSGDGSSQKKKDSTKENDDELLPADCPGGGDGVVCARLTRSQVARLGPFPSDEARDAFAAGDAGVCARPQGALLPPEAGDPEENNEMDKLPSSPTAAAAAAQAKDASTAVPLPSAYFPLSNYSTSAWPVPELALRNLTLANTTRWVEDSTFGTALECSRADSSGKSGGTEAKDAAALLPNVPLGPGGAFAVNVWMRQYGSPGAGLQYLFSARASGLGAKQPLDDPAFFMPGQAHIFLPGDEHPGGRRLVRAIVKDTTDSYAGRHSRTFLDSDGVIGSDAPRATPRQALADGEWHMVTLTTLPEGGKGYELYVDGTRRGSLRDPTDYWHVDGGAPLARSPVDIVLCGRSDRSSSRFFDGRVAQLALFDEALSPAAVEALWKAAGGGGGEKKSPPRGGTSASSGVAAEATAAAVRLARQADARDAELDAMLTKAKSGGSGSSGPSAGGGSGLASGAGAATQSSSDNEDESWTAGPIPKPPPSETEQRPGHGHGAKHAPAELSSEAKLQRENERVAAIERGERATGKKRTVSVGAAAAGAAVAAVSAAALAAAGVAVYLRGRSGSRAGGWRREALDGRSDQPDSPADGGVPGVEMSEAAAAGKGKAQQKNPFAEGNGGGSGGRVAIDISATAV